MALYWFLAGVLSAALHTLTLWWTVATIRPKSSGRALVVAWAGAGLRMAVVAGVCAAAASHSLSMALLTIATFALARLVLTNLISQRMRKSEPVLPS